VQFSGLVCRSPAVVLLRTELQGDDLRALGLIWAVKQNDIYRRSDGKVPMNGSFDGSLVVFRCAVKSCAVVSGERTVSFFRVTDKPDLRLTLLHTKCIVLS